MDLPFTEEQFFSVFADLNEDTYPVQWGLALLGVAVAVLALSGFRQARRISLLGLAVLWGTVGWLYHIERFASINPAAYAFGGMFLLQAALLAFASFRLTHEPAARNRIALTAGCGAMAYGLIAYPLLVLAERGYPGAPLFGLTPCPTTIFTIGVLLSLAPPIQRYLLIVPLAWAVVGGSAALLLEVPQDFGLIAAGVAGLLGIRSMRAQTKE